MFILIEFVVNFFGDLHSNLHYVLNKIVTITFDVCIFHASLGFRLTSIFFLFLYNKNKIIFQKNVGKIHCIASALIHAQSYTISLTVNCFLKE